MGPLKQNIVSGPDMFGVLERALASAWGPVVDAGAGAAHQGGAVDEPEGQDVGSGHCASMGSGVGTGFCLRVSKVHRFASGSRLLF